MSARWYEVATPEWDSAAFMSYEPPDRGREFLFVFARNAKRAKVLAVRALRRQKRAGWIGWESDNPYAGDWRIGPALEFERYREARRRLARMRRRTAATSTPNEPGGGR